MTQTTGKLLMAAGGFLFLAGVILYFRDSIPFLKNLGNLPGDISIQRENFTFHFPVATSIIVSIVLSLILFFLGRFR